jgi:hypothetical protein
MAESHSDAGRIYQPAAVECYSGYKANERPVAFSCQDRRWEIADIIDRWYEGGVSADRPVVNYFKVRTGEGLIFILRYAGQSDSWSVRGMDSLTMEEKS